MAGTLKREANERLRAVLRKLIERGMTQLELAPKIGMSQSSISGFLSGRQGSSYEVARAAARLAGIRVDAILGPETDEEAQRPDAVTAVFTMGRAQGFPSAFLDAWRPELDDFETTPDQLWTQMKADFARWQRRQREHADGTAASPPAATVNRAGATEDQARPRAPAVTKDSWSTTESVVTQGAPRPDPSFVDRVNNTIIVREMDTDGPQGSKPASAPAARPGKKGSTKT